MSELGRPFSEPYQAVIDALEDRVRNGVEQPALARFTFEGVDGVYELPAIAHDVTRVSGLRNRTFHVFEAGLDYRFANNRVVWFEAAARPDRGTRFEVGYTYRERPAGLTDFNPGSVVGTLVRAVARQMKLIYDQMDEAYRRAFIDEASGVALDNVVALLGVTRNPALAATGEVTFFRRRATNAPVAIPRDTRVADESGRAFRTAEAGEIAAQAEEFGEQSDGAVRVADRVAEVVGVWPREVDPDDTPPLDLAQPPVSGEDERTITLADGVRPEGQLRVRYRPKSVDVPVEAVQPGPEGNVNAGTIVIMPTPPAGIDGVVNEEPAAGGLSPESDDRLRQRAKHALERAGNATLGAIRFAVLGVDGVDGVEVADHSVDDTIPLGEVRVRYSGGERAEVERAIEETRAAGVIARPDVIVQVLISGAFYLIPEPDATATAAAQFRSAVLEAIRALAIGAPLSVGRLNALAYDVPGLADVAEAQLLHDRAGTANREEVTDPFLAGPGELLRPDAARLGVVLVSALAAERSAGSPNEVTLRLVDSAGDAIGWKNLLLDVSVVLRARLRTAPEQPPERVGGFTRALAFADTADATLTIAAGDAPGFRPDDHLDEGVEVVINAAAYPGISGAATIIDLPPVA